MFCRIWVTLVYGPIAHLGRRFGSRRLDRRALDTVDFAGGTVGAHQRRYGRPGAASDRRQAQGLAKDPMKPHNLPFVMLGAALLWFGWFGFNAGSSSPPTAPPARPRVNTMTATSQVAASRLADRGALRDHHATSLGAASGVVAGLVAITPAAAAVSTGRCHRSSV